ncbi:MAG: hypothetical protein L6R41_003100 [Letrouitia leprolyta]|nr:MAG: hypothetical protein L6R41_003100 [Letrouitia leprolyta]
MIGILVCSAQVHGKTSIEYIIWPKANISQPDANSIEAFVKSLMVDPTRLYVSKSILSHTPSFWLAQLSKTSYEEVSKHPEVEGISPNDFLTQPEEEAPTQEKSGSSSITAPILQSPALESLQNGRKIFREKDPITELRVVSSAPNVPIEASPDYVYSIDESEDTFIYIPDYGINRAHWDFSNLGQKRIEWLYTPQTILHKVDTPTELDWPWPAELGSHATCVASKAVGRDSGVARHATFVVVKMWPSIAGHAEIFDAIVRDIVVKRRTHHSVVNFSAGSNKRGPVERAHVSGIQELIRRGVPVIVAAGNSGPGFVTAMPAKLSDRKDNLWGPIVVGSVDCFGRKSKFSKELQYGRMLWAPGEDVKCAAESPDIGAWNLENGTSFGK